MRQTNSTYQHHHRSDTPVYNKEYKPKFMAEKCRFFTVSCKFQEFPISLKGNDTVCFGDFDYYPFGSCMQGRVFSSAAYRYGFNGKEEETDGTADNYDFGARIYDGRLGRWLAVDPKSNFQPFVSPYKGLANNPITMIDPDGKYEWDIVKIIDKNGYATIIKKTKSNRIMTDGKIHYLGNEEYKANQYYDYASTVTTIKYNSDGKITKTIDKNVILYENGVQDDDGIYWGDGAKAGTTKIDWGSIADEGKRKHYQEGGFEITTTGPTGSKTKYYSKSQVKTLKLDELLPVLKMASLAQVKNMYDRAGNLSQGLDYGVEGVNKLIDVLKSTSGKPGGVTHCKTCGNNYKNDSNGRATSIPEEDKAKPANDTIPHH